MLDLSYAVKKIAPSATLAIAARTKAMIAEGIDVISLSAGEPDLAPGYELTEAALNAIRDGNHKYVAVAGIPALRDLVAQKLSNQNNIPTQRENVIITPGAKFAIYAALRSLINPDDEVILFAPYWVSYPEQIKLAGGLPKIIKTSEDEGFKPDLDELEGHITARVKGIILNYPSNPAGASFSEEELRRIGELAVAKGLFIISDEIYEPFSYDQEHVSIASLSPKIAAQTITVNGFSKSFSIPGWRVGYAAGDADVIKAMISLQSHSASNVNTIAQLACIEALQQQPYKALENMVAEFKERREFIVNALNDIHGMRCHRPEGAFYVYPNIQYYLGNGVGGVVPNNSQEFVEAVLDKGHVSMVPGSAFGMEGHVRISFTQPVPRMQEALKRLNAILEK